MILSINLLFLSFYLKFFDLENQSLKPFKGLIGKKIQKSHSQETLPEDVSKKHRLLNLDINQALPHYKHSSRLNIEQYVF